LFPLKDKEIDKYFTVLKKQWLQNSRILSIKIVKNERDPSLFTGKLLIKFQSILRNTTQVIIRHRVKILFSVISSPITLNGKSENRQKRKGSSSLHQLAADKILKDSKKHNSSYRTTGFVYRRTDGRTW
jgi:hypothetical protein